MKNHIDLQYACFEPLPVCEKSLVQWVEQALSLCDTPAELTLRLVEPEEMIHLNKTYRKQNKTTNVLAFPANLPKEIQLDYTFLGDIVICPAVLLQESESMAKPLINHWAHIVIHGVLHLLGYDHLEEAEATIMAGLETKLLAQMNLADPYQIKEDDVE